MPGKIKDNKTTFPIVPKIQVHSKHLELLFPQHLTSWKKSAFQAINGRHLDLKLKSREFSTLSSALTNGPFILLNEKGTCI